MLKIFIFFFCIWAGCLELSGQNVIGQINKDKYVSYRNLSGCVIGERFVFGFKRLAQDQSESKFQSYLVNEDKSLTRIDFTQKELNSVIAAIQINPDLGRLYLLTERDRKSFVIGIEINFKTGVKTYLQGQFELSNKLIGSRVEGQDLILYSFNKDDDSDMVITRVSNGKFSDTHYTLPIEFGISHKSDVAFIPTSSPFVSISQALKQVKFIPTENSVDIVIDGVKDKGNGKTNGTLLLHVNLSNKEVGMTFVNEPDYFSKVTFKYRSYLCDQYLFRATIQKKLFTIKAFDRKNGEMIYSTSIKRDKQSDMKYVTVRENNKPPTQEDRLSGVMSFPEYLVPIVIVAQDSASGKFNIICGTNNNTKFSGPLGLTPAALITSAIMTTAKQLSNSTGRSLYFYYYGDLKNGLDFYMDDPQNGARSKIDKFEMTRVPGKSKIRYDNLSYWFFKKGILGAYEDETDNSIKLIEF